MDLELQMLLLQHAARDPQTAARDHANYLPVLMAVWELARAGRPAIVAIDGRCGSGKTRLAALLCRLFPCAAVHMDDFYLLLSERMRNWSKVPAGNIDLTRLEKEVLEPRKAGRSAAYRPYDCRTGRLSEPIPLPDRPLIVIEGSYAHHPRLAPYYDLKLFLTCSRGAQTRRLQARERERFWMFEELWIPMEERYFYSCGIEENSALTLDTSGFF